MRRLISIAIACLLDLALTGGLLALSRDVDRAQSWPHILSWEVDTAYNLVTATQVSQFSAWAIGVLATDEPTAVTVRGIRTLGALDARLIAVLLGPGMFLAVACWVRRRR
jgi:hypothetical protein